MRLRNGVKSQKQIVLEALQSGARLTQDTAMVVYGVRRLASRIAELKGDGHKIEMKMIVVDRSRGMIGTGPTRVAEYYLSRGK